MLACSCVWALCARRSALAVVESVSLRAEPARCAAAGAAACCAAAVAAARCAVADHAACCAATVAADLDAAADAHSTSRAFGAAPAAGACAAVGAGSICSSATSSKSSLSQSDSSIGKLPSSDLSSSSSSIGGPPKPAAAGILPHPPLPCLPSRATAICVAIRMLNSSTFLVLPTELSSSVLFPKARRAITMSAFVCAGFGTQPVGMTSGKSCAGFGPPVCPLHGRAVEQDLQQFVRDAPLYEDLQLQPGVAHARK